MLKQFVTPIEVAPIRIDGRTANRSLSHSKSTEMDGSVRRKTVSISSLSLNKAMSTEKPLKRASSIKKEIKKLSSAIDEPRKDVGTPLRGRDHRLSSYRKDSKREGRQLSSRNALNPHSTSNPATVFENEMNIVRQISSFLEHTGQDEQQAGIGKETPNVEITSARAETKKNNKPNRMNGLIRMISGSNNFESESDISSAESIEDVVEKKTGKF